MTARDVTSRLAPRRRSDALAKSAAAACAALAASLGFCPDAAAWGLTGHRVTAAIGDKYLSAEARAAVREILEPGESLAEAANFPDFMRASDDPFWKQAGPFHFVTVPKGKTYVDVGPPPQGDAVTALKRFSDTIKNPAASPADKRVALRFIVHIVGDLHQPLHNGNGLDSGGNDVKVKFFGADVTLHSVWDEGLIELEKLSYTEWTEWLSAKITEAG